MFGKSKLLPYSILFHKSFHFFSKMTKRAFDTMNVDENLEPLTKRIRMDHKLQMKNPHKRMMPHDSSRPGKRRRIIPNNLIPTLQALSQNSWLLTTKEFNEQQAVRAQYDVMNKYLARLHRENIIYHHIFQTESVENDIFTPMDICSH